MSEQSDDKKIFIDEDWKTRVEVEREAAAGSSDATSAAEAPRPAAWPEPSLVLLATTLATQAMASLGLFPHPVTGKTKVDLPQAQHFIDTIAMLVAKTEGNRSEEETSMLEHTLHELRMVFVAIRDREPAG